MASRYSIIQYVPNPIAEERINIGVLVFDRQNVKVHFLLNWDRVRSFGRREDIKTLKDFADRMQKSAEEDLVKDLLKIEYPLRGQLNQYHFDVAVAKGKPILAAQGISFEVRTTEMVLNSVAWMISDTKQAIPELPLAIITLPPKTNTPKWQELQELYEIHSHTYQELGAEIVTEKQADSWISKQLASTSVK